MRTLTAPALAALSGNPLPLAILVEMDLSSPLNLNTSSLNLVIGGITYTGIGGLGKIDAVSESPAEVKQLKFELSGVPSTSIALALGEPVQGKAVRIKLAIFDPVTYLILDTRLRWAGLLDVMSIDEGNGTAVLSVTAEHSGMDLQRPVTSLYSNAEQLRLHPGDTSFQFNVFQVDARIVWPNALWGRK